MKKLFKETTDSITHQTPGQTAMKGLFTEQDSNDETASSPNQGAMKKLFNQSTAPASPVMEKTVLQGVFAENDETDQPSTVESIFKGMADKSFSHYTTPSKKTPFESDHDIVSILRLNSKRKLYSIRIGHRVFCDQSTSTNQLSFQPLILKMAMTWTAWML